MAVWSKSLTPTEQAWSTFERELFALHEALIASNPYTKGFRVVVYTDHKNNLFTGSLLANRRVNKKLLRWAINLEEVGDMVQLVWIKGADNVLGDAPSRNPAGGFLSKAEGPIRASAQNHAQNVRSPDRT